MCYAEGSVDQAVNACPMCKVFPHSRCPHVRDVCRNRSLHPRIDVLYLKNAEVDWFNGCGYCKWANTNPPAKSAGFNNPGWPGCCRQPVQSEYRMIRAADWRSVSIVHHIPIPSEVKSLLDSITTGGRSTAKPSMPSLDRKSSGGSGGSPTSKTGSTPVKPSSASVASKTRPSGSPKSPTATISKAISSSLPNAHSLEGRRDSAERDKPASHSTHSSPNRKQLDLESNTTPRRNSASRAPLSTPPLARTTSETRSSSVSQSPERRRTGNSTAAPAAKTTTPSRNTTSTAASSNAVARSSKKDDNFSSASSNSGGSDSLSDSTITSDGGFTDYLSDESEAELQRQAEARAALLAQNQAEELEFKAARQQLAHVDLRPPKSWHPTNITNGTTAPRLATGATTKG